MKLFKKDQKGFTLIELMIVVAIIGILAAIAIPKFASMLEKSREGATKGNVGALRSAMAIYYGDREGIWPTTINNASGTAYTNYLFSVYMDSMPDVKVTHSGIPPSPAGVSVAYLGVGVAPAGLGNGWAYDSFYGHIYVNSTYADTKGNSYTTY